MLSPQRGARLLVPRGLDGLPGRAVAEAAHRDAGSTVYWDLDGQYLGATVGDHRMALPPIAGAHLLTLTDAEGRAIRHPFTMIIGDPPTPPHVP